MDRDADGTLGLIRNRPPPLYGRRSRSRAPRTPSPPRASDRPGDESAKPELNRVETEAIFQKRVFFVQNLGFITPTEARRISFAKSLRFERVHEETYRDFGFELVPIAPGSLSDRVEAIKRSASVGAQRFVTV